MGIKSLAQGSLTGKEQIWASNTDWCQSLGVSIVTVRETEREGERAHARANAYAHGSPPPVWASTFIPAAPLPVSMFPNLLHKVLLMPGFLEVDTVRGLLLHSPPPAPGSGPQFRAPSGTVAAKGTWASKVSRAMLGTANAVAQEHAGSGRLGLLPVTKAHTDVYEDPGTEREKVAFS